MSGSAIVQAALNKQELSVRGFARLLAGDDAEEKVIERWRRAVYRVLDDKTLTPPIADAMEESLALPRGCLPRYEPRRRGDGAVPSRAELAQTLAELEATVESLERSLEKLERRVDALEHRPSHGASVPG